MYWLYTKDGIWFKHIKDYEEIAPLLKQRKSSLVQKTMIEEGDYTDDQFQIEIKVNLRDGSVLYSAFHYWNDEETKEILESIGITIMPAIDQWGLPTCKAFEFPLPIVV